MKKRLLPALLALVMVLGLLPMAAFADTGGTEGGGGGDVLARDAATEITKQTVTDGSGALRLTSGSYKLMESIEVKFIIGSGTAQEVTLDLNGNNITQKDEGGTTAMIYCSGNLTKLTITNSQTTGGKIASKLDHTTIQLAATDIELTVGGNVTLECPGVTQENGNTDGFAIVLTESTGGNTVVNLNGCTLSGMNGLTVKGNCESNPTVNLNGAIVNATGTGLYLAGVATTNVNGGEITSKNVGIEIRNGDLTVKDSAVITGGSGNPTDPIPNGSGTTAANAGIAVSQHTTKGDISVGIEGGAKVSAASALYVVNPQDNPDAQELTVTVSGEETKLTATNDNGNAIYNQSPVDVAVTGGVIDGNVTMAAPAVGAENTDVGSISIAGAEVKGDITNESGDNSTVSVKESVVTGTIDENVGVVKDCTDGDGDAIEDVFNSNPEFDFNEINDSYGNSFPGMWDVKVSGMQNGRFYLIRIGNAAITSSADPNSIIIVVDNTAEGNTSDYTISCKPGQFVSLFEIDGKPDWSDTTVETLTEVERAVANAPA